ncbi:MULTISPECIES: hypothetical protein [Rhodanobacter]|uniref:Uncharacterized protein n=1 Tax=Rhodanobacter hydrolyticus TaxID=2250595 RepID=A0ABW8J231_9GAMM|nr:hypothetical protein [Rhodanobacter sp. 7MK24]MBD8880772.1 hypothetical protein [Rhodanobacter sp. 7MK24]
MASSGRDRHIRFADRDVESDFQVACSNLFPAESKPPMLKVTHAAGGIHGKKTVWKLLLVSAASLAMVGKSGGCEGR